MNCVIGARLAQVVNVGRDAERRNLWPNTPNSLRGTRVVCKPQTLKRRALRGAIVQTRASVDSSEYEGAPATLTPETEWRFVLTVKPPSATENLEDIPEDAPAVDVVLRCSFAVDEGYEPPQGTLTILEDGRGYVVYHRSHKSNKLSCLTLMGEKFPRLLTLNLNLSQVFESGRCAPMEVG